MGLTLCIETATEVCSIAIAKDDELLAVETTTEPFQHASLITSMIDECVRKLPGIYLSNLDSIAVSEGPGSFTGLRVGLAAAKGLCFALNIPLVPIGTLKSLAFELRKRFVPMPNTLFCSMLDAKRLDVYYAIFDGSLKPVVAPTAATLSEHYFSQWFEKGFELIFGGNAVFKLDQLKSLERCKQLNIACSAEYLISLAHHKNLMQDYSEAANFVPKYLKPPNITKPRKVI